MPPDMNTIILFVATVLIWGTTWIGISAQIGEVPLIQSIFLRFALAGIVMLAGLAAIGRMRLPHRWRFVLVQALCLFSFNFVAIYNASALIPSGLVSVVFSLASIFNAINARLLFGDRITARVVLAGVIGATGLFLLFQAELSGADATRTLQGIGWAGLGTMIFSLGNMASRKNSQMGISPVVANSWGMGIGALVLLGVIGLTGTPMVMPTGLTYWTALVYLSVIGSVIGFTTYLMLVARIGSARAGYATVIFPVVALLISTLFEGFRWTPGAVAGLGLVLLGNVVMFSRITWLTRRITTRQVKVG